MAFTLLDGSDAAIDIVIGSDSWKCMATYISCDIERQFTEKTTFCTGGWRSRQPGLKQLLGRIEGFASKGAAFSDPLHFFSDNNSAVMTFTATTGCTITASIFAQRRHIGDRAAQNSEDNLEFESTGAVTTTWVIV